jgi:predicted nucleotidyltransferase
MKLKAKLIETIQLLLYKENPTLLEKVNFENVLILTKLYTLFRGKLNSYFCEDF